MLEYLEELYSQFTFRKETLALHKIHCLKLKLFFFPCPSAIMTFSSLIIDGISEKRNVSFELSYVHSVSSTIFCFIWNSFCVNTFSNILMFINTWNIYHFFPWEAVWNRNIIIECFVTFGRTGSRETLPIYLRSRFDFTTINPFESASLGKILHIFAVSMGILHLLPLIFTNSPFQCIIAIFLNIILLKCKHFF